MTDGEGVFAEVEFRVQHGVARVRDFHVLGDARDGDVEVQIEGEDGSRDEHHEYAECRVLEIGYLDLHGSELHPPSDVDVGWGRFKAHVLPVSGL